MIGIFKQKSPAGLLMLLVLGVLVKLPLFLSPVMPVAQSSDGFLYKDFIFPFMEKHFSPLFFSVFTYLLLVTQAIQLNAFVNHQRLLLRPSFLTGMSYLLITSFVPEWSVFSAPLLVNTILLYILNSLLKVYNTSNTKSILFNNGLLIGVGSFIFFPSVFLLLWLLIGVSILRPFRLNEWLLCILGCITPFYFFTVYLLLNDRLDWNNLSLSFHFDFALYKPSIWMIVTFSILLLGILAGTLYVQNAMKKVLILVRKSWGILTVLLLVSAGLLFLGNVNSYTDWVLLLIPIAVLFGGAFSIQQPKLFVVLFFWLCIGFILYQQFGTHNWA